MLLADGGAIWGISGQDVPVKVYKELDSVIETNDKWLGFKWFHSSLMAETAFQLTVKELTSFFYDGIESTKNYNLDQLRAEVSTFSRQYYLKKLEEAGLSDDKEILDFLSTIEWQE
jgi:hypothetical protein